MKKGKKSKRYACRLGDPCDAYGYPEYCNKECDCFIGEEGRRKRKEGKGRDYQDRKELE